MEVELPLAAPIVQHIVRFEKNSWFISHKWSQLRGPQPPKPAV